MSLSALTRFSKVLLLFGLNKREQDAVYIQELAQQPERGQYALPGRLVCRTAYLLLRGIGKDRLTALLAQVKEQKARGNVLAAAKTHGNAGTTRPSLKTILALNFLVWLALSFGDANPVTGIVHVWMFRCVSTLWVMFGVWCLENGVGAHDKLGISSFFQLFQHGSRYFHLLAHVRWKRCVTQKICSTCGSLMVERRDLFSRRVLRASIEWLAWEARSAAHHALIWAERKCYADLRALARAGSVAISMFIIDASKPLRYPRRLFDSQAARGIPQISGAFVGVLSHSTHRALAFTSPVPGVPIWHGARVASAKVKARSAGTNFTWESTDVNCTILLMVLLNDYRAGLLHRHIHIQVDGGSDARGFVLVMLLALLVSLDIVDEVTIASLIPGHTHDDVDAFFSRLWKALKTRAGVMECRTWGEILARACEVFPGWHVPSDDKVGSAGVTTIAFVWRLRELFGQGNGCSIQSCLSPQLKGLFGAGKDHAVKPSKFVIVADRLTRLPVLSAYLSSVRGSPLFQDFDRVQIFRFAPDLDSLGSYDLSIGWHKQHDALVAALNAGDCREAGYSFAQRDEIARMVIHFPAAPKDPFGSRDSVKFAALLALGLARAKGVRAAAAVQGKIKRRKGKHVNDEEDAGGAGGDGAVWDSEANEAGEGGLEVEDGEPDEPDEPDEEEVEEQSENDGPQYEIEDWLDRRFNSVEQCNEYSIKFVGYPEPEWTLERRIGGEVPRGVDEMFDRRSAADKAKAKSARQAAAFRAINSSLLGADEDGGDDHAGAEEDGARSPAAKAPRRSKRNRNKK